MTHLKKGDKAPEFSATDQHGNPITLKDLKGKRVILYFYPKDNTPTCTEESCNLRDNYKALQKKGFTVIGVSNDSERKHQNFIKKYTLPFDLIADTDKKMVEAYGVYGEKQMFGKKYMGIIRTTFVINPKGKIEAVFDKVDAKNHTQQILETL